MQLRPARFETVASLPLSMTVRSHRQETIMATLGGGILASGGTGEDIVEVWNAMSGKCLGSIKVLYNSAITAVGDERFVVSTKNGYLIFFTHFEGKGVTEYR